MSTPCCGGIFDLTILVLITEKSGKCCGLGQDQLSYVTTYYGLIFYTLDLTDLKTNFYLGGDLSAASSMTFRKPTSMYP